MARTTIDFGIDLGTTNSAISVLRGTITDIIKNNLDNDITASAVYIDKRGSARVGLRAKNRLEDERSADDVYVEFKRRMGTAHEYKYKSSGRILRPEDLSAEVLKSLRGDVQQRLGEDAQAAVITVPAAFEQKQCAATRHAAELAGFAQCPLVQEPVAAALAYGFQAELTKAYWLIYDFGGGTFDSAVIKAEDGTIAVVNHGGDNYLGGSDIDWAIVEQIVLPQLRDDYNLPDISRGNRKWGTVLSVIKRSVEIAKIQLSRSESAYLEDCRFKDADGEEVELEFKLTRDALVNIAEPIIMRSVEICKRVLKEKNLSPSAIERTILVGGPTLAPYFRDILQSQLGIPLDFSVDPLTVVARGAAVFAGTQRLERKAESIRRSGQFEIDLKYKPVGADEDPTVRGTVIPAADANVAGCTIEFINEHSHWRSGRIPLKDNGRFKVNLLADKGTQNVFSIEVLDPTGRKIAAEPGSITYTIGLAISEQPIINSIAVALANNEADVFFKKGEPLPAKAMRVYRSTHAVQKGSEEHILNVPVVEGGNELADRNRLLGKLLIKGSAVRRDVPAGSEVEVTLLMDASRLIRAKAYIPMLDEEYEAVIDHNAASPDPARLQDEFENELDRLESIRSKAEDADDGNVESVIDQVESGEEMEAIERLLDAAKADPDAANNAEKRLLEIKVKIDQVEDSIKWPALVSEANQTLDDLDALIDEHGTEQQRERAEKLRQQVEDLIQHKRPEALRRNLERALELHREVLFEQPGFWLGFFNHLIEQRGAMNDQATADRLFNQGQQFIERGNVPGLRNVVAQLLGLIPQEEADAIQRGYQSGLLR